MKAISQKVISLFEPSLTRLRLAVEHSSMFRLSNCGVIRDGPHFFTIGVSCEAVDYSITDVTFSCVCFGFSAHHHDVAEGHLLEPLKILGQVPGNFVSRTNHPVQRHCRNGFVIFHGT